MTIKRATVSYGGPGLRFLGATDSGHVVAFDDEAGDSGARPMEALLAALGACTAMDVLSILRKKRQPVSWYRVRVEGEQRAEHPHVFTDIRVIHEADGHSVEREALRRAIQLSAERYCSVGAMLAAGTARVSHWYLLRGAQPADDEIGEVVSRGPGAPLPEAVPA
ncbi:MAG TPA: OsmC family protein [Candidatus Limnocylindrales bacterium]|jgi:putative redox protein